MMFGMHSPAWAPTVYCYLNDPANPTFEYTRVAEADSRGNKLTGSPEFSGTFREYSVNGKIFVHDGDAVYNASTDVDGTIYESGEPVAEIHGPELLVLYKAGKKALGFVRESGS